MTGTKVWCEACFRYHQPPTCRLCLQGLDVTHALHHVCPRCQMVLARFRAHGLPEPGRLDLTEYWLPAVGLEGAYLVSSFGRIRSLARTATRSDGKRYTVKDKILSTPRDSAGYPSATLAGRTVRVHQVVAAAFLGPRPPGQLVRHAADDKNDNWIGSLSYGSPQENSDDGRRNEVRRKRCARGHSLTPDNVYIRPDGRRLCLTCIQDRTQNARSTLPQEDSA